MKDALKKLWFEAQMDFGAAGLVLKAKRTMWSPGLKVYVWHESPV